MTILKASLYTFLVVILTLGIGLSFHLIYDNFSQNIDYLHYNELLNLVPYTISFLIMLFLVFKIKIRANDIKIKGKQLSLNLILYTLIIAIGLELLERPFIDFNRIIATINNESLSLYEHYHKKNITLFYDFLSAVVIAPLVEELFFRKFLFTQLHKKYSLNVAIISSSLLFSAIHLPDYNNIIPTLILGVVCSIIYVKTKNIMYPIILHSISNLIWFLLSVFGEKYYSWMFGEGYGFMYLALVGFGVLLFILGFKKITTANNVYN